MGGGGGGGRGCEHMHPPSLYLKNNPVINYIFIASISFSYI